LKIVEYKGTGDFLDFAPLCSTYACGVDDEAFATGMRSHGLGFGRGGAARQADPGRVRAR
jgi:hypothetical protein